MKDYEISFFRELVDSAGHRHLSRLDTFVVTGSESLDQAARTATEKFENTHDIEHWWCVATDYEIRPLRRGNRVER